MRVLRYLAKIVGRGRKLSVKVAKAKTDPELAQFDWLVQGTQITLNITCSATTLPPALETRLSLSGWNSDLLPDNVSAWE